MTLAELIKKLYEVRTNVQTIVDETKSKKTIDTANKSLATLDEVLKDIDKK